MIFNASDFVFNPPAQLSWARRVLIKPCAGYALPYPMTTSPEILKTIIKGIRKVSDADIIIADGTYSGEAIYPIYEKLGYDFRHVLTLDIKDSLFLEIENPLEQFLAESTFWIPNLVIRSDFLISVTPFKVCNGNGWFSIANLFNLLQVTKYKRNGVNGWDGLKELGIDKVLADLYFTLPFDLGIIEAKKKYFCTNDNTEGRVEECGKILVGEPYEVDQEASALAGLDTQYLRLIEECKGQLES
jgi:uncharacterized protein (DUF362 family)